MVVPRWVTGAKPMVRRSCDESSRSWRFI